MPLSSYSKKAFETRPLQALLLFLLFSVPILFTLPDYGITHDEPIYMEASRNVRQWLSLDLRNMLSQESIEQERTFSVFRQDGKKAVHVWSITVDSVPLLGLYRIEGSGAPFLSGKGHP